METDSLLIQIAVALLAARLFAEIAVRLRTPPIIGEMFAGIIIGPSLLGWVSPSEPFKLLAEIGIILLLFEVGLETDLQRLAKAGPKSVVVAVTGFVLPFLLGSSACYYLFELSLLVSLFIGGTLTATSIGITIRVLSDLGRQRAHEGQIILGAAVIDDLLGVLLLAVLYEFAMSGSVTLMNSGKIIIYVGGFFLLAPVLAKILSPFFKRYNDFTNIPGVVPVVLVSIVLIFAELAHIIGAPHLLGGFAAGIALSRRFFLPFGATLNLEPEFTACVHEQMKPIIRLFTPIFFVMVGLSMDLGAVDWSSAWIWMFSIGIAIIAIVAKLAAPFLIRESIPMRIAIGMAMVPRGEVGLIFAELGRLAGLFSAAVYAGLILVIAYTTLAAPFWIKLFYGRYGDRLPKPPD
ncbi:MAG: cation:proton antiporter [Gammaproteobacteria bacterium]